MHPRYWQIAASAYVIISLTFIIVAGPSSAFALSVLVVPHEQDFNITRSESSTLISYRFTANFLVQALLAFVFTKLQPKAWIIIGSVAMVTGLMAASVAPDFLTVCLTLGVLSAVGTGILYGTAQFLIPCYFPNSVALVTGLVFSGMGIGSLAWSTMMTALIQEMEWRRTLQNMSIFVVALCLPILFMPSVAPVASTSETVEDCKEDVTKVVAVVVAEKSDLETGQAKEAVRVKRISLMDAILTRGCVVLGVAQLLLSLSVLGVFGHLSPFYTDDGLTASQASLVVSLVGIAQIIGRPLGGLVADRWLGSRKTLILVALHLSVTMALWTHSSFSFGTAVAFAMNFGISFGAWWPIWAGAIYEQVGSVHFAKAYAVTMLLAALPGCMFSASMFGLLCDITGSYKVSAYGASGVLLSVVVLITVLLPPIEQQQNSGPVKLKRRNSTATASRRL